MNRVSPEMLPLIAARLRALADESRLALILALKPGPRNVSALVEATGVAQASVSKHLAVLRDAGLVEVRRQANQAIYSICDVSVFDMCQIVCGGVARHIRRRQRELAAALPSPPALKRKPSRGVR